MMHKGRMLIFIFFVIGIFIRLLYHHYNPNYTGIFSDSVQYVNRAIEISQGKHLVNPFRFPLYPFFLSQTLSLKGQSFVDWDTAKSLDFNPAIRFQQIIGIIGLFFSLVLAFRIFKSGIAFITSGVLLCLHLPIFGLERNILTETVSINLILILLFFIFKIISTDRLFYLPLLFLTFSLLFLAHPAFLFLPLSVIPVILFMFWQKKQNGKIAVTAVFLFFYFLLPLFYLKTNERLYGYRGLSTISEHNLLAKVVQYKLDTSFVWPSNHNHQLLAKCVRKYRPGTFINIIDCLGPLGIADDAYATRSAPIAGSFARQAILRSPSTFIFRSFSLLPFSLVSSSPDPVTWVSYSASLPFLRTFWSLILIFYNFLQYFTIAFFVFFPLHLYRFLKNPNRGNALLLSLGSISFYLLSINTFFSFINFVRLRSPIEIPLLLFCLYYYFFTGKIILKKFTIHKS